MKKEPIYKYFAHVVVGIAICAFSAVPRASAAVNLGASPRVWQNPLPQGNGPQGANSSAGGSLNCIAVGDLATIFGTGSVGSTLSWTSQVSNTTQMLRAVACTPESLNNGNLTDCFAVGDDRTILATTDQRLTWTSQCSAVPANLRGISCQTTVNCFAVGGVFLLSTTDGGALTIDPILAYGSYLGGSGVETRRAIATDSSGNVYIAGATTSLNFPVSSPAYQPAYKGGTDASVTKLNGRGTAILCSTYLGGSNYDQAWGLAVDVQNNSSVDRAARRQRRRVSAHPGELRARLAASAGELVVPVKRFSSFLILRSQG